MRDDCVRIYLHVFPSNEHPFYAAWIDVMEIGLMTVHIYFKSCLCKSRTLVQTLIFYEPNFIRSLLLFHALRSRSGETTGHENGF